MSLGNRMQPQGRGPRFVLRGDRLRQVPGARTPEDLDAEPRMIIRRGRLVDRMQASQPAGSPLEPAPAVQPPAVVPISTKLLLAAFIFTILLPVHWNLGSLRLTPPLIILLGSTIPFGIIWMSRKRTPIIASDWLMLGFCAWAGLAIVLGPNADNPVQTVGILFLQTFGAYLFARMTVRDAASMRFMITCAVIALLVILPFTMLEALTGRNVILELSRLIGLPHLQVNAGERMGLHRAQGPFQHPILMGVFSASVISLAFYGLRRRGNRMLSAIGAPVSFANVFLSLSTGPLLSANIQFGLMLWSRIMRTVQQRWRLLIIAVIVLYTVMSMLTTRSPFHTFVRYATFSSQSSYNRILIWEFGSAEAMRHPFFGIGMGDWTRPRYMSDSMDNFWLLQAVRYGMPALAMLVAAIWLILIRSGRAQLNDEEAILQRRGIMFALVGTMVAIASVHLWAEPYIWFTFLVGAAAWFGATTGPATRTGR